MGDKGTCWSITINNPNEDDNTTWSGMSGLHWVLEAKGQLEKGENGTLHLQGMLRTKSVRFAQVKKALPRAHIEKARSQTALAKYVAKEDTRVSSIPTVKVATLTDVQKELLGISLQFCYTLDKSLDPLTTDESTFFTKFEYELKKNWEQLLDRAVEILIWRGFYGVEFVVANPQIRTAFRKYLPAILYRTYNATQEVIQEAHEPPQESSSPQGVFEGSGDCSNTSD